MLELDMPLHGTSTHVVCMNIRDQAQMNYITMLTAGCSSCTSS